MPQPDWEELERRVARLERLVGVEQEQPAASLPVPTAELPSPSVNIGTFLPVLGRALLGLAGAYLLRALTESDSVPRVIGVGTGILYALFWLFWAARTPAIDRVQAAVHSLTAVLVLCPLLWEATLHFHAVSTWLDAGLLAGFVVLGIAISWRQKLPIVPAIVTVGGVITAAGLLIATRDVVPFTMAFLAIAAATETSICFEHRLNERWLAAAAADLAMWLVTWLMAREHGLPEGYAPISHGFLVGMQAALVGIYLASTIVRTLVRGLAFTGLETAQCAAVFLIGVGGGFWLSAGASAIAAGTLVCAAACYAVSFVVLDRGRGHGRNFYIYSTFGILLLLTGSRALLAGMVACSLWCVLAMGCIWAGVRFGRMTLQVHGGIYLLLALAGSGALTQVAAIALGSGTWPAGTPLVLAGGTVSAGLCYWMASRVGECEQVFRQALAAAFVWLLAGLATGALAADAYGNTLRTCSLAFLSLLLAWAGGRWSRAELSRLIYPAMILGAYRLIAVDFNQNRKLPLFLSLLAYGGTLMALPRLTRSPASSST
jgi:hypothetical protein